MPTCVEPVAISVLAINMVTFCAFGIDKRRARLARRRVPEGWLLGLSFATGLVGGWLAMSVFRHKTRKLSFRIKMVLVSVFNAAWLAPLAVWAWSR